MSAPDHCPCCGAHTGGIYPPTALLSLRLSSQKLAILRELIDAYPAGVPWLRLAAAAQAGVGGGGKTRKMIVVTQRALMKHTLASLGWATISRKGVVTLVRI